ncbi:unnamed protein product [Moneuplotes crassus]|uniref:Uncharacterized protein n=1 Tax=Euplotes crassus TaxID=5936 RepID=A0AAD1U8S3_EUPCR|nr:unnamed protein product [Moneuplotes crassus]
MEASPCLITLLIKFGNSCNILKYYGTFKQVEYLLTHLCYSTYKHLKCYRSTFQRFLKPKRDIIKYHKSFNSQFGEILLRKNLYSQYSLEVNIISKEAAEAFCDFVAKVPDLALLEVSRINTFFKSADDYEYINDLFLQLQKFWKKKVDKGINPFLQSMYISMDIYLRSEYLSQQLEYSTLLKSCNICEVEMFKKIQNLYLSRFSLESLDNLATKVERLHLNEIDLINLYYNYNEIVDSTEFRSCIQSIMIENHTDFSSLGDKVTLTNQDFQLIFPNIKSVDFGNQQEALDSKFPKKMMEFCLKNGSGVVIKESTVESFDKSSIIQLVDKPCLSIMEDVDVLYYDPNSDYYCSFHVDILETSSLDCYSQHLKNGYYIISSYRHCNFLKISQKDFPNLEELKQILRDFCQDYDQSDETMSQEDDALVNKSSEETKLCTESLIIFPTKISKIAGIPHFDSLKKQKYVNGKKYLQLTCKAKSIGMFYLDFKYFYKLTKKTVARYLKEIGNLILLEGLVLTVDVKTRHPRNYIEILKALSHMKIAQLNLKLRLAALKETDAKTRNDFRELLLSMRNLKSCSITRINQKGGHIFRICPLLFPSEYQKIIDYLFCGISSEQKSPFKAIKKAIPKEFEGMPYSISIKRQEEF